MRTPKVLIASGSQEFCQATAKVLHDQVLIQCCLSGGQAIDLLRAEQPDIFLVDLMLPEMDGLAVLQTAAAEGIHPAVLVILDFPSPYTMAALSRLQVSYVMQKPCSPKAIAVHVSDLLASLQPAVYSAITPSEPRAILSNVLAQLGMVPKWDGFCYLLEGLPLFAKDPHQLVTKELYSAVGRVFDKDSTLVERSIRSAIEKAWVSGSPEIWRKYFPAAPNGMVPRPSNKVFIAQLVRALYIGETIRDCG